MTPGPELDRLIAEHVMGWRIAKDEYHLGYYPGQPNDGEVCASHRGGVARATWGSLGNTPAETMVGTEEWEPSTNIAHAWEVVEKLQSEPVLFNLATYGEGYIVSLCRWTGEAVFVGDATTAPHAICLAALKAVGYPLDNTKPKR